MSLADRRTQTKVGPRWDRREQGADGLQAPNATVLDTQLTIETPEHISFAFHIAGPFRRLMAYLLDLLISQFLYWLIVICLMFAVSYFAMSIQMAISPEVAEFLAGIAMALVLIGSFCVTWFYGAYAETKWNGQTFGKRLLSLRVLSTDGSAIDSSQATLRNFFRLLDLMPFVSPLLLVGMEPEWGDALSVPTLGLGLLIMASTARFSRAGDWVAGTMVVFEPQLLPSRLADFTDSRVASLASLIPGDFQVSSSFSQCLAHYVSRRAYLGPARCQEIANHLVPLLLERFQLPRDTDSDLLMCALYHRAFLSTSQEQDSDTLIRPFVPEAQVV